MTEVYGFVAGKVEERGRAGDRGVVGGCTAAWANAGRARRTLAVCGGVCANEGASRACGGTEGESLITS